MAHAYFTRNVKYFTCSCALHEFFRDAVRNYTRFFREFVQNALIFSRFEKNRVIDGTKLINAREIPVLQYVLLL